MCEREEEEKEEVENEKRIHSSRNICIYLWYSVAVGLVSWHLALQIRRRPYFLSVTHNTLRSEERMAQHNRHWEKKGVFFPRHGASARLIL